MANVTPKPYAVAAPAHILAINRQLFFIAPVNCGTGFYTYEVNDCL